MKQVLVALAVFLLAAPALGQGRVRNGAVRVSSEPPGAQVSVDGGETSVGTTPIRRLLLPRGTHQLTLTRTGFVPSVVEVEVGRRTQRVDVPMVANAVLIVEPATPPAVGAVVVVNNEEVGRVPLEVPTAPGRVIVRIESAGQPDVVLTPVLRPGGRHRVLLTLPVSPVPVGHLMVTADVPAEVYIAGRPRGPTPVVTNLAAGSVEVEVRALGQHRTAVVAIREGALTRHAVVLSEEPLPLGTLSVSSEPSGAEVEVDGVTRGNTPLVIGDLPVGERLLRMLLAGYESVEQVISIEAATELRRSIRLAPVESTSEAYVIRSNVPGAEVWVDGEQMGVSPTHQPGAAPGIHRVEVRAVGHVTWRGQCDVAPGGNCELVASLAEHAATVEVLSTHAGGQVTIDGASHGTAPAILGVEPGTHDIVVAHQGAVPQVRTVILRPGELRVVRFGSPVGAAPEPLRTERSGRAAGPLPSWQPTLSVLTGFPYLLEVAADTGLGGPLDAGASVRTLGRLTELELRGELGATTGRHAGLALRAIGAFGLGPDANSIRGEIQFASTLRIGDLATVTTTVGFEAVSDGYGRTEEDSDVVSPLGRQNQLRLPMSISAEWWLSSEFALLGVARWWATGTDDTRRVLGDLWGSGLPDPRFSAQIGLSYAP